MRIRTATIADIDELARVYVSSWRTTYQGLAPDAFVKGVTEEAALSVFRESLDSTGFSYFLHLAVSGDGRIVGFIDGGRERSHPESGTGEIYGIYLLREVQGKGTGRLLFHAARESFAGFKAEPVVTWVVENSPARGFYERQGGRLEPGIKTLDVAGQKVNLVRYVWRTPVGSV